jgi:hypothetical protein
MPTLFAVDILGSRESRVLDTLLVNIEFLCHLGQLTLVDAVVLLTACLCLFKVTTDATLVDEATNTTLRDDLLLGVQHVIALLAEAHSLKLWH